MSLSYSERLLGCSGWSLGCSVLKKIIGSIVEVCELSVAESLWLSLITLQQIGGWLSCQEVVHSVNDSCCKHYQLGTLTTPCLLLPQSMLHFFHVKPSGRKTTHVSLESTSRAVSRAHVRPLMLVFSVHAVDYFSPIIFLCFVFKVKKNIYIIYLI